MIIVHRIRGSRSFAILALMAFLLVAANCSDLEDNVASPTRFVVTASEHQTATTAADGTLSLRVNTPDIALRGLGVQTAGAGITVDIGISTLSSPPENAAPLTTDQIYQYFEVTHPELAGYDVVSVVVEFAVSSSWLDDNGVSDAELITLERFTDSWETVPTEFTGVSGGEALYRATSPGLSLFAIAVKEELELSPTSTPSPAPVTATLTPVSPPLPTITPTPNIVVTQNPTPVSGPALPPTPTIAPPITTAPTRTPSAPIPTVTPSPTLTPAPTAIPTHTPSPTATLRPTNTPLPTRTPTPTLTPEPTATPSPTPSSTPTATSEPTVTSSPTPTPSFNVVITSTPTQTTPGVPTATPTTTPVPPTPTGTPVPPTPTGTPVPPTPTFTPVPPTPTFTPVPPTPLPTPDPKYAVVVHTKNTSDIEYFMNELEVDWFLDYQPNMNNIPPGKQKLAFVQMPRDHALWNSGALENIATAGDAQIVEWGFSDPAVVRSSAFQNPGLHWYLFSETNRRGYMHGDRFAPVFKYWAEQIRLADSTAIIMSPSILNWGFTCVGCLGTAFCENFESLPGYQCGKLWLKTFVSSYESRYGTKPPIDAWSIDVYPLDWINTPNSAAQALKAIEQIDQFRRYLDSIDEFRGDPIWITEVAVHIGYHDWFVDPATGWPTPRHPTKPEYENNFQINKMAEYLTTLLDWLERESENYSIEKWFFFTTWKDITTATFDGYMGIIFFEGQDAGSGLNCLGKIFRSYSLTGTSGGNTCPTIIHNHEDP